MGLGRLFTGLGLALFTLLSHTAHGVAFKQNPINLKAYADRPFSLELITLLSETGSGNLTWGKSVIPPNEMPAWVIIEGGIMKGTPPVSDDNTTKVFRLSVKDGDAGSFAQVNMTVVVAPEWTESNIDLGVQKEDATNFSFDLKTKLKIPGNVGPVTITAVSGKPDWMVLSNDGVLTGIPKRKDVGPYSGILFKATLPNGESASANAHGRVEKTIHAPKWKSNPVILANAQEDFPYSKDLIPSVNHSEPTPLTFKLLGTVPAWLSVTEGGNLFGTPGAAHLGPVAVRAEVSSVIDGQTFTDETVIQFEVKHTNHRPQWTIDPVNLEDAITKLLYTQDLKPFVKDPDAQDTLTFKIVPNSGPAWATVTPQGVLSGKPDNTNLGLNTWIVEVSDGEFTVQATIRVRVLNRAPTWLATPVVLPNATEDFAYTADLKNFSKDPDSDALTFANVSVPGWLTLSADGTLKGTPKKEQLGTHSFKVTVSDGFNSPVESEIQLKVDHTNHAAFWTQDPVTLPKTQAGKPYAQALLPFAKDIDDGDTLTFTKISGPTWVSVSPTGQLTGNPAQANVGNVTVRVRVADQLGAGTEANVTFSVFNAPPRWTQNPIALPQAVEDAPYAFNLAPLAVDDDGDTLTFTKVSGPAWLQVAANGAVTGTPTSGDIGNFTAIFEVSDGPASARANANGNVKLKNRPPVVNQPALSFVVKERSTFNAALNTPQFVTDPNNDTLTFALVDNADWVTLAANGALTLKPLFQHIGDHALRFNVSDGEFTTPGILNIKVVRDPRPPVWSENPIRFQTKAREPFTASVADKVKDLDGLPLTFSKISGPAWLSVDNTGKLSGTPDDTNLGANTFSVLAKNDLAGAETQVIVTVLFKNHPPFWTQNPIALPNGKVGKAYSQTVAPFAKDPDPQDTLTFTKVSGPAWASVTTAGLITGTPSRTDKGKAEIVVRVADPEGATAETTVLIVVPNTAPRWTQDPLQLGPATEDNPWTFNIAPFAVDDDGDPLTFKKLTGPNWFSAATDGALSGTPASADLGDYTASFEVTDGDTAVQVQARGKVVLKNHPPAIKQENLNFTVKERQIQTVNLNQALYVTDPNNDTLQFQLVDTKDWVTLSTAGSLKMSPVFKDIGDYALKFTVSDGTLSAQGVLNIKVVRDPRAPVWTENPIHFQAKAREPFTALLSGKAKDLDNLPITFTKVSGPAWLSIDAAGAMSGTPQDENLGANTFVVNVKNDLLGADANVIVTVLFSNHPPFWTKDPIDLPPAKVAKAYSDNIGAFAKDPDASNTLTITKVSGPTWVSISPKGAVTGTPTKADKGVAVVRVRVTDNEGAFAEATVNIPVPNTPPVWTADPIQLGTATQDKAYNFALAPFAKDDDSDTLTFKKISGPNWLLVDPEGKITGTPAEADLGDFVAVFEVTDGEASAQTSGKGKVVLKNVPPTIKQPINFTVKEREVFSISLNQSQFVEDPNGDNLTFSLPTASEWVTLAPNGDLRLAPLFKHIGDHQVPFKVSDGTFTSDGMLSIKVVRDPRPPVWLEDPIRFQATANEPFTALLSAKAKDLDGLPLTFSMKSGPAWLTVDAAGALSGTPKDENLGDNFFVVTVKNDLLGADASVIVKVMAGNHAPFWTQDPIRLPPAKIAKPYAQSIASFAKDIDPGDTLTFSKISGTNWVTIGTNGSVTGTPGLLDKGDASVRVRVTDSKGAFAEATINILVPNTPPKWTQDPIPLGNAEINKPFTFNLATKVVDEDGDPLKFKKVQGPAWLLVAENGAITGTPAVTDLGEYTATFEVFDGTDTAAVNAFGKVVDNTPKPPTWEPNALAFTVKEREVLSVNLNQPQYIKDPQGGTITFQLLQGAPWVTLSSAGMLEAKPLFPQIGEHTFNVKATNDKGLSSEAPLRITVVRNPRPPVWMENPIRFEARVDQPFSADVAAKAKDLDNLPLTFSKKSGPAWLTVSPQGALSGTPLLANLGENVFEVTVRNDLLGADVQVIITVKGDTQQNEEWQVDQAHPGAQAENIWVMDNSWPWIGYNKLIKDFKDDLHFFYEELERAHIKHTSVYLNTDVHKTNGFPVKGRDGSTLMLWSDSNWIRHFLERIADSYTKKCYSSPIWAMHKFYEKAPTLTEIYHKGFFTERVPSDALIVTASNDHYRQYSQNTPFKNFTAVNYAKEYLDFHKKEKQDLRISVVAPECPKLMDAYENTAEAAAEQNPYKVLAKETKGKYYPWAHCAFDMSKVMKDYAKDVIFRAYVHANGRITLKKKPSDPSTIQVKIAGVVAPNTLWFYEAATNEVVIRWELYDMSKLKPGDKIEIKYRAR